MQLMQLTRRLEATVWTPSTGSSPLPVKLHSHNAIALLPGSVATLYQSGIVLKVVWQCGAGYKHAGWAARMRYAGNGKGQNGLGTISNSSKCS